MKENSIETVIPTDLQSIFIILLSRLPRFVLLRLRNFVKSAGLPNTLSLLDDILAETLIEIFYFCYHCIDRALFLFVGPEKRAAMLDDLLLPAIYDLELVYGSNPHISQEAITNLDARNAQYGQYRVISNADIFQPSVVSDLSKKIANRLQCPPFELPIAELFIMVDQEILKTLTLIAHKQDQKSIPWSLKSPVEQQEAMIAHNLLSKWS